MAYHPVCDGMTPEKYTPIACLAYPKNEITNTRAFKAATFSVEVLNGNVTAASCVTPPADSGFESRGASTIQGTSFSFFEFQDAGMNQYVTGRAYRIFHGGRCYQLGINVATANADVFDPPAKELSRQDLAEINRALEQARDSFCFLK